MHYLVTQGVKSEKSKNEGSACMGEDAILVSLSSVMLHNALRNMRQAHENNPSVKDIMSGSQSARCAVLRVGEHLLVAGIPLHLSRHHHHQRFPSMIHSTH